MTARRLIVEDASGSHLNYLIDLKAPKGQTFKENPHNEIDLTDLPNANAAMPFVVAVQERCNLGHWHTKERIPLPPWGSE